MRVVITGSHGVGKTSLVGAIAQTLAVSRRVKVVPEIARQLVEERYDVNDRMNLPGFLRYLGRFMNSLRTTSGEVVLFDRSLVDLHAYAGELPAIPQEARDLLRELLEHEFSLVDEYLHVPIEFDLFCDGVRPADKSYQRDIDERIRKLLDDAGVPVVRVSGSISDRANDFLIRHGNE